MSIQSPADLSQIRDFPFKCDHIPLNVERISKRPRRALWAARHLKSERAKLNFGTRSFPRHSGRASVSFACLPEVLDELRMSFRILDVEVDAQHSQPCGKHLRGI
jgi:hypothetical protein